MPSALPPWLGGRNKELRVTNVHYLDVATSGSHVRDKPYYQGWRVDNGSEPSGRARVRRTDKG